MGPRSGILISRRARSHAACFEEAVKGGQDACEADQNTFATVGWTGASRVSRAECARPAVVNEGHEGAAVRVLTKKRLITTVPPDGGHSGEIVSSFNISFRQRDIFYSGATDLPGVAVRKKRASTSQ